MPSPVTQADRKSTPPRIDGGRRKRGNPAGVIGAVALLGALLAAGILPRLHRAEALRHEVIDQAAPRLVSVVTPLHGASAEDLVLPGNMEAIEQTALNSRVAGYLRSRYVDIGDSVKRGQLLAEIDAPEVEQQLAQARSEAVKAEAAIEGARAVLGTQRAAVAQAQADASRFEAAIAQAQADTAKTQAAFQAAQAETQRATAGVTAQNAEVTRTRANVGQARAAVVRAQAGVAQARQSLAERKANQAKALSDQEIAKKTWERWTQLLKQDAVSVQDAEEKKALYEARASDVQAAGAAVSSAQANVEAAQAAVEASRSDVAAAEASVGTTQANVQAAQAGVSSNQASAQAGQEAIRSSQASVEAARAAWKSSQAMVRAAQQRVGAAEWDVRSAQAALKSARANVERIMVMQRFEKITAPFDGVVVSRSVDTGSLVNAGTPAPTTEALPGSTRGGLFMVARSDFLRIRIYVPQAMVPRIKNRQPALVTVREFPHREFHGEVRLVAGALDPNSRTMVVGVLLPNEDHLRTPGMVGSVRLASGGEEQSLRVPSATLVIGAEGTRVATVTPEGTIHYVTVELGDDLGKEVEIRNGLTGKEQLVDSPSDDLVEGASVKAVPVQSEPAEGEKPPAGKPH
jgi:RND family efflux transporter MFP subunit